MKNIILDYNKIVKYVCLTTDITFLVIHIAYAIIFGIEKIDALFYFNIFSIIFYISLFIIIKIKKYEMFTLLASIEITIFLTTATLYVGFGSGFEICFIGLCVLAFIAKYFFKENKIIISPIIISSIFLIDYVFTYCYLQFNNPIVQINKNVEFILFLSHSLIVFIYVVGYMCLLLTYIFFLEKGIRKESETDQLTNLPNRKALQNYYDNINKNNDYILSIFDIDDFKILNDKYGHLCGDYILKTIADLAKENINEGFIARWGGEEFVIISNTPNYELLESLRDKIEKYDFKYKDEIIKSTITVGIAKYQEGDTLDNWIDKADKFLYIGKTTGKNKIIYEEIK